ncbi:MAG: DUF6152 family protein [Steroidobacteraceae bacterium]
MKRHPPLTAACCAALATAGLGLVAMAPAQAHHSVVAAFDMNRSVDLDGTVRSVELSSPHGEVVVENVDAAGHTHLWRLELLPVTRLRLMGWTDRSLTVGEHVHVSGNPSRYQDNRIYPQRLERADGTRLPLTLVSSAVTK